MPWEIRQIDSRFCVVKEGETAPIDGGCHDTREAAQRQLTALNIEYYGDDGAMRAVPARYRDINFSPPQSVRDAARVGINLHEAGHSGDGLEPTTVLWANRIASGEDISPERAKQGYRFFARNERFLDADRETPAYTSAMLWFGRPGMSWFNRLWRQMEAADADAGVKAVIAIKAADGAWQLDVLGVPFGSVNDRDAHGEYFSEKTQLYSEKIPLPPVVYYHGFTPDGRPQSAPEFIGQTTQRWTDQRGVWYRVVLDQANTYARRVWEAAQRGIARASSGTMEHLRRVGRDGHITHWLVSELSLFDIGEGRQPANRYAVAVPAMKALYSKAGLSLPTEVIMPNEHDTSPQQGEDTVTLTRDDLVNLVREARESGIEDAPKPPQPVDGNELRTFLKSALSEENQTVSLTKAQLNDFVREQVQGAVSEASRQWEEKFVVANRLPMGGGGVPYVMKAADIAKYDHTDTDDLALLCGLMQAEATGRRELKANPAAYKALAVRIEDTRDDASCDAARPALKAAGIKSALKSDEIMYTTAAAYGAEWVAEAYSTSLWRQIRVATMVLNMVPQQEVPQGFDSIRLPIESGGSTWYRVAQTSDSDYNATTKRPNATVPATAAGTAQKDLSLKKIGSRTIYTKEMEEDSIIPLLSELRRQMVTDGAEILEHVVVDGDETLSSDNINTTSAANNAVYTALNGMRHLALVTSSATNSRSALGWALTAGDFVDTARLLGEAGIGAVDTTQAGFILPLSAHWKAIELQDVLTREKIANPTIENGRLSRIFGYPVYVSAQMLRQSASRQSLATGYIDDTDTNNTTTQILCVRWDDWRFGFKRRMMLETVRRPESDTTDVVITMRIGLVYRNSRTAAAITHNISMSES